MALETTRFDTFRRLGKALQLATVDTDRWTSPSFLFTVEFFGRFLVNLDASSVLLFFFEWFSWSARTRGLAKLSAHRLEHQEWFAIKTKLFERPLKYIKAYRGNHTGRTRRPSKKNNRLSNKGLSCPYDLSAVLSDCLALGSSVWSSVPCSDGCRDWAEGSQTLQWRGIQGC